MENWEIGEIRKIGKHWKNRKLENWGKMGKLGNWKNWNIGKFEGALCCNMIHISDWSSSVGLFEKLKKHLFPKSKLLLYGPFIQEGVETSVSNINFNITLKKTNPAWGIRRLKDINLLLSQTKRCSDILKNTV